MKRTCCTVWEQNAEFLIWDLTSPLRFQLLILFFSVSHTQHLKQDATGSICSVSLKGSDPTRVAVFSIFLMFSIRAWWWLHQPKHVTGFILWKKKSFCTPAHCWEKRLLALPCLCVCVCVCVCVCPSVPLLWTAWLPLDGFSWICILQTSVKIFREN